MPWWRPAAGGWLRWREEVLLGRFGEPSGQVETDLRVDIRTRPGTGRCCASGCCSAQASPA